MFEQVFGAGHQGLVNLIPNDPRADKQNSCAMWRSSRVMHMNCELSESDALGS